MASYPLLYITSEFPPGPGGIANHGFHLVSHLARRGFEITVYAPQRSAFADPSFDRNLPFAVVRYGREGERARKYHRLYRALKRHIEQLEQPPVVMASGGVSSWVAAALKRRKKDLIAMAVAHGTDVNPHHRWKRFFLKKALTRMDRIVAVSRYTAGRIDYLPNGKVVVINNGVDLRRIQTLAKRAPLPRLAGKPRLVTVGTLSERKGQMNVVRALPLLKKRFPEVHYHMVGLPDWQAPILEEARRRGVAEHITVHGALSDEQMVGVLKASDIFMMLSQQTAAGDFEGFGIAILEANVLGMPAVGTRRSGIADAVNEGLSGRLVDPAQPADVCKAVEELLANYDHYARGARQWAEQFDWARITDQYEQTIRSLL